MQLVFFHQNLPLKLLHHLILIAAPVNFSIIFHWRIQILWPSLEAQQSWRKFSDKFWWKKSRENPEDFHLTSLPVRDQWKWWRHFKLQAKMLSELIIRRDSVYTLWLTYLHLHCTNLCTTNITTSQLDLQCQSIWFQNIDFNSSTWTDRLTDWLHCIEWTEHWTERVEILDAGDREEEREDGEEISFLDKFWSESEHEEGSAESWYQRWYTNAK